MVTHEDVPREVMHQAQTNVSSRRVHPLVIVAAGAVTLFCAVGIGVMTGLIPSAHSLQANRVDGAGTNAPIPLASHAATPIGTEAMAVPAMTQNSRTTEKHGADRSADKKAEPSKRAVKSSVPDASPSSEAERTVTMASPATSQPIVVPTAAVCTNCGVVDGVLPVAQRASASGAGAVVGGVLGGVLGRQVGKGRGKDLATVAGAVGGAVLGNSIEKNVKSAQVYDIRVRMEDGSYQTVREDKEPGVRVGDRVRIENGHVVKG